ncbi:MAG: TonB-dependent receptor, partial [Prevotellaceae bacterium]|nr:TonB-dependent receptor [Prevotellaceae bacterium]
MKLQGTVTDSLTSERLSGASVYLKQEAVGVETSRNGEYLLQLLAGEHRISISFVGYKTKEVIVNVQNNTVMNFALAPVSASLDAAVVSAEKTNVNVTRSETGIERLQIKQIRLIPALMGEVDILKAIRMLPGVQATSEGSSSFSVRGGSPDQNLILFDEATVYNASHLMGFFSVFNNDAVEDLKLYKGDIPPIYGGRLSSLLAVSSHELSANKFTGTGGIGTISSRLAIEAPIGKNLSVFGAGRRTYADLFLKMMPDKDIRDVKLYFYDLNGKINWRINAKNRLFVSAYDGKDKFKNENMYMNFGNRTLTLRWNSLFSEKFFMNLTATNSEYNYNIGSTNESLLGNWIAKTYDWGLKSDFTWLANSNSTFKFGISAIYHVFHPGDATAVINKEDYGVYLPHSQAVNWAIYAGNEQKISSRITLRYGLRAALFQNVGPGKVFANIYDSRGNPVFNHYSSGDFFNNYWTIEPRAGLVYAFNEATSFKANYSRSSQFL